MKEIRSNETLNISNFHPGLCTACVSPLPFSAEEPLEYLDPKKTVLSITNARLRSPNLRVVTSLPGAVVAKRINGADLAKLRAFLLPRGTAGQCSAHQSGLIGVVPPLRSRSLPAHCRRAFGIASI